MPELQSSHWLMKPRHPTLCLFNAAAGSATGRALSSTKWSCGSSGGEDHRMDIEAWLQGLGLERYVPAFRDNEIDWEVLPKLTSDDLREIGVAAIGHRRKLLEAIAAIGTMVPTVLSAAVNAPAPADAERRQLSVMFCDLVGSTPLSTRFDPEDLREIVGAYHRCVADTVGGFAGFVAKYMGDGVLVYFGYPEAHEDDAERAARAGLAVIDAVSALATPEPLNVRLGVASGLVVVGDLIGAGAAQERGVGGGGGGGGGGGRGRPPPPPARGGGGGAGGGRRRRGGGGGRGAGWFG